MECRVSDNTKPIISDPFTSYDGAHIGPRVQMRVDFEADADSEDETNWTPPRAVESDNDANVTTSLIEGTSLHSPAFDIDVPIIVHASSTPGHHHIYFPSIALEADEYAELLRVLTKVGIVQPGWVKRFEKDGMTVLRKPGVKK